MPIPKPERGLVIRFDYLCDDPKYAARHFDKLGEKARPCMIVIAVKEADTGQSLVTIAPSLPQAVRPRPACPATA
jgi:hypothetical protein